MTHPSSPKQAGGEDEEWLTSFAGGLRQLEESMGYSYEKMRPNIFTEDGQVTFLKIRDAAKSLLKQAGAVSADRLMRDCTGDSWTMIACIDRLIELGELVELQNPVSSWAQHRVFIDGKERP